MRSYFVRLAQRSGLAHRPARASRPAREGSAGGGAASFESRPAPGHEIDRVVTAPPSPSEGSTEFPRMQRVGGASTRRQSSSPTANPTHLQSRVRPESVRFEESASLRIDRSVTAPPRKDSAGPANPGNRTPSLRDVETKKTSSLATHDDPSLLPAAVPLDETGSRTAPVPDPVVETRKRESGEPPSDPDVRPARTEELRRRFQPRELGEPVERSPDALPQNAAGALERESFSEPPAAGQEALAAALRWVSTPPIESETKDVPAIRQPVSAPAPRSVQQTVDVRIGSVSVEIHDTASPQAPAAPPPLARTSRESRPALSASPSRLRRHYLKGGTLC